MAINYTIDFETTGINIGLTKAYNELGRTSILSPKEAFKLFGHLDITQYAIHDDHTKEIRHYSVKFNGKQNIPSHIDPVTRHTKKIPGLGDIDAFTVNKFTERDFDNISNAPWSKLKGTKKDFYKKRILPGELNKAKERWLNLPTENGNMYMSQGAFELGLKSKALEIKNGKVYSIDTLDKVILPKEIKAKSISYDELQNILKQDAIKMLRNKQFGLGAWNPYFDINLYMAQLQKMGATDLAEALYKAYTEKGLQPNELERVYKAFVWQLGKENPELGNMFRIGYNPVASAATGRSGQIAKTINEYQYVGGYKAENAAQIAKIFGIDEKQLHLAGADIKTELAIKKVIETKLQEAGLDLEGIYKGDTVGNLSKYLDENNELSKVLKTLIAQHKPLSDYYSKYPSLFEGERMASFTLKNMSKVTKMRLGALGGLIGLGLLGTYGLGGDDKLSPFSDKMKIGNFGTPKQRKFNDYFEDKHNSFINKGILIGSGILGPLAGLYGVGAYSRFVQPKLLGYTPKLKATPSDILGTIYRGIREIEGSYNISRVFQLGIISDQIFGRDFSKGLSYKTIRDGKIVPRYVNKRHEYIDGVKTKAYKHGIEHRLMMDQLKGKISEADHNKLSEWLAPTSTYTEGGRDIISREIRFGKYKNGATVVYAKEYIKGAIEGQTIAQEASITLPVHIKQRQTRISNIDMAYGISRRGASWGDKHYINSVNYQLGQELQVKYKDVVKSNFNDWSNKEAIPKFIERNSSLQGTWSFIKKLQYNLELYPKGIGESVNKAFDGSRKMLQGTKTILEVLDPWDKNQVTRPIASAMIHRFNRFLESPFEFGLFGVSTNKVDSISNNLKASGNIFKGVAGKALSFINRPHLGLSFQNSKWGTAEWAMKFGLKRVLPAMAAWEAFRFADHALGALTFSPTGRGPLIESPIKAWQGLTLAYSKISDITGFTRLTKKQEEIAPGSTRLGVLAPAMTALSFYKAGSFLYKRGPIAIRQGMRNIGAKISNIDLVRNALREEKFKGQLNRSTLEKYMSWSLKNPKKAIFGLMMMPMLPFLPGVLGSNKSYEERKAEYQGKKDVAIRKYRGWLLSSSPYEGGKPIQFRRHMMNIIQSDYENRGVVWPNYWERFLHNVTLGLYKPYILEDYHKKSQPVYESAPYGAHLPLIGQPIAATIGKLIKPTKTYHELDESKPHPQSMDGPGGAGGRISSMDLARSIGIQSESSNAHLMERWSRQYHDLIGFTGFTYETARQYLTGQAPRQFNPTKESAVEFYNPAQQMWGWKLGDITGVGGEFLRRMIPYPMKNWKVNDLPNELYGVSWIPQESTKKEAFKRYTNDVTHGTTFDNVPLGWLYGTRKGWENLYPEVRGKELEEYPDHIRLEVLKSIAPYTQEFRDMSKKVQKEALNNQLSLYDEQRFYETLNQVRQLKDKLYANRDEYSYKVATDRINGIIDEVDENGMFTLEGSNQRYRLAGVSLSEADIRANLLNKKQFNSQAELVAATNAIRQRTSQIISSKLRQGSSISFDAPSPDQMNNAERGIEAVVGGLNQDLIEAGAPFTNTGNLSEFNMQQDRAGYMGTLMSRYWSMFSDDQTFFASKFIPNKDYLTQYKNTQVFNREVKLWSHPIKHILEPAIASFMHQYLGLNMIPSFTKERRQKQEYWDMIKYVKYKMLAVEAAKTGNLEEASYYHNMWRSTMIGADPTDENTRDELAALPENERAFYTRFANEPDPEKRGEIYKYLPRGARRIYSAIWNRKIAESGGDNQGLYQNLVESEGWGITARERKMYMSETGGNATIGDWIRTRYAREYFNENPLPGSDWIGWSSDVDLENVELLALKEGGENIQDYGFFDNKLREAVFDQGANIAAAQLKSVGHTANATMNQTISYIIQDDRISEVSQMPTMSQNPISIVNLQTDGHEDFVRRNSSPYASILSSMFNYSY